MAVYNLAGGGVQGLSSGVVQIFVDVVTFPLNPGVGRGGPTNYYDVGLLRFGQTGSYRPTFPIDAASMIVDVPHGTNALGFSLFGTTNIRVTEVFGVAPGNPLRVSRNGSAAGPADGASHNLWTYTVPSGRVCRFDNGFVGIVGGLAANSDVAVLLQGNIFILLYTQTSGSVNQFVTLSLANPFVMLAGEVLTAAYQEFAGPAGSVQANFFGWEFDAGSWTPA